MTDITREAVERETEKGDVPLYTSHMLRALRDALDKAERERDDAMREAAVFQRDWGVAQRAKDEALEALRPLACECARCCEIQQYNLPGSSCPYWRARAVLAKHKP